MHLRRLSSHPAYSRVKEWKGINWSCFFNPKKASLLVFQNNSIFRSHLPVAALGKVSGPRNYSGEKEIVSSFLVFRPLLSVSGEFREVMGKFLKIILWEIRAGMSYHIFMEATSIASNVSYSISLYKHMSTFGPIKHFQILSKELQMSARS